MFVKMKSETILPPLSEAHAKEIFGSIRVNIVSAGLKNCHSG
jgi:hypothetical protein